MKAMILAAGRGSRMGKVTKSTPKPLTLLSDGNTLIENNIYRLRDAGISEIVINVSWLGDKIMEYLGSGKKYGVKIFYSDEMDKVLGTGGGISAALRLLGDEPFWVINADVYTNFKIINNFQLDPTMLCHLILVPNPQYHKNGDFNFKNNFVMHDYKIKKKQYTFSGISILSPKLFVGRKNKKFALEPVLKRAARHRKVSGELFHGIWEDVGTQNRLKKIKNIQKKVQ